uniref:Secreted protein n=1 Tax=Oryza sativa subsp. japonica TaxID=39947 RepID=Q6KAC5_ORYSJ|nr:hypothetical protein [Oryza sativa Japonica Group]
MVKTAGAAMPRALLLLGLDAGAEMCYEQAKKRDEPTTTTRKGARRRTQTWHFRMDGPAKSAMDGWMDGCFLFGFARIRRCRVAQDALLPPPAS